MYSKLKFLLLLSMVAFFSCLDSETKKIEQENSTYTLHGSLVNSEDDTIILYKPHEDPYFQNIKIPVVDGRFSYEFEVDEPVGYDLMYWNDGNPAGRWMTVFLEKSDIKLTIYPQDEWDKNMVVGGKINNDYQKFNAIATEKFIAESMEIFRKNESLFESGRYFSPLMQELVNKKKDAKGSELENIERQIADLRQKDLHISESVRISLKRSGELNRELKKWEDNYIRKNNDVIAYYLFLTQLSYNPDGIDLQEGKNFYKKFSTEFPDHPYNKVVQIKLENLANITVGQKFKNFTLPNIHGEEISLSEKVQGKKAVINLWGTWCRPCIVKNRELVPVFNDYKDRNFTVVGVAGEFKDTKRLERFLDKEEYPWINLVELDAQNFIWEKYGVSRSGGGLFLIDEKGIIVAVKPSVEEIKDYLENTIQ